MLYILYSYLFLLVEWEFVVYGRLGLVPAGPILPEVESYTEFIFVLWISALSLETCDMYSVNIGIPWGG